jgi:hypothetical protein
MYSLGHIISHKEIIMQQFFIGPRAAFLVALLMQGAAYGNNGSYLQYIFGSQPASEAVQKLSAQADERTGFTENPTTVLQMNALAKLFGYSSFNWFNTTWVDEASFEGRSDRSIIWQLIHEKYHTLAGHDVRRIIGSAALKVQFMCMARDMYKLCNNMEIAPTTLPIDIGWSLFTLFLFLWHEEQCEIAADAYADRMIE